MFVRTWPCNRDVLTWACAERRDPWPIAFLFYSLLHRPTFVLALCTKCTHFRKTNSESQDASKIREIRRKRANEILIFEALKCKNQVGFAKFAHFKRFFIIKYYWNGVWWGLIYWPAGTRVLNEIDVDRGRAGGDVQYLVPARSCTLHRVHVTLSFDMTRYT